MRILKLHLINFQGIIDLEIIMDGKNVNIYGENSTGKTTIFNAFAWVLFDKDSLNQSNFEIKPIDPATGETIHGLDSEVEAVIEHNGSEITLRKVYYEKWVKERGHTDKTFSGNTTDHYVDGVPVPKGRYDETIKSLADENVFKLLTNPLYFNETLPWMDRRNLLLAVCGDIGTVDVIKAEPKLAELKKILKDRSLDDHKRVLVANRKEINEKLEKIPVRIDEVQRSLPDLTGIDFEAISRRIDELRAEQDTNKETINNIKNGAQMAHLARELAEIESQVITLKNKFESKKQDALRSARGYLTDLANERRELEQAMYDATARASRLKSQIEDYEGKLQELRSRWTAENTREPEISIEEVCPTCERPYPEEDITELRDKALAEFNLAKSKKLEDIARQGKEVVSPLLAKAKKDLEAAEDVVKDLEAKSRDMDVRYQTAKTHLEEVTTSLPDIEKDIEYQDLNDRKKTVRCQMDNVRNDIEAEIRPCNDKINEIEQDIREQQSELAKKDQHERSLARIEELKAEERELAKQFERVEYEINLAELYIRTKVSLLDERINSKFKMARFRLFEEQVNGGLRECCETTYKGVPYSSINNAAKINIGIDIVNTLSQHYNVTAPIFIDNAESVVEYIPADAQLIRLYVSGRDKKLRIEQEV